MTEIEERKLVVIRHALVAIEDYLDRGEREDLDIEALIMYYGRQDNVTADEAHDAIEENLIDAFRL